MSNEVFDGPALAEKLSKLNNSQQSIECILDLVSIYYIYMVMKAKPIVETWDKFFNSSQREQRISFLYLANDILQNSRRKGSEFVNEFWKVLPGALKLVYENGDEHGKKVATRLVELVSIWCGELLTMLKKPVEKSQLESTLEEEALKLTMLSLHEQLQQQLQLILEAQEQSRKVQEQPRNDHGQSRSVQEHVGEAFCRSDTRDALEDKSPGASRIFNSGRNPIIEEKVEATFISFLGDTLLWYQFENIKQAILSWEEMKQLVLRHFRDTQAGSLYDQFVAVRQEGTIIKFKRQFIRLLAPLDNVSPEIQLSTFINGLRPTIRAKLRLQRPRNMMRKWKSSKTSRKR
ncbi:hypothetical protein F8388_004485 [Cannabis sativa]|uniref:CID domain-containing protein n=1 Tax=Cannabis sativa TaxID=3483 RepID=A0A7J6ENI7_CANSA|nr:hypothetical protein F8388_004485 [Cannabis sativa]